MIRGEIIQDIKKYEPKFIGPFTIRQFVCVLISGIFVLGIYFGFKWLFTTDALVVICIIIAMPFVACGWIAPYGIPLEKFLFSLIKTKLILPSKRKYKTDAKTSDIGDIFFFDEAETNENVDDIELADIESSGTVTDTGKEPNKISKELRKEKKELDRQNKKADREKKRQVETAIKELGSDYKPYN